MSEMEKITGSSPEAKSLDITNQNIEQLKQLFPDVFSEGKIDFEALRAVLGEEVDDSEERYNFTWNGKTKARQIAQTPSTGTLRPCKDESVNWDTTENLFIEGDNLEVLKLLQKSYHKKVKMIYIDPPYNTGKDFVYKDNFKDNIQNYLELTGQINEEGRKLSTNTESSGRFHTDWLNMIYPRLKLARNLLKADGVIFISIDDSELNNLQSICNEIFGETNFIAKIIHKNNALKNQSSFIGVSTEYVLVYAKNIEVLKRKGSWKETKQGAKEVCDFVDKCFKEGKTEGETLSLVKEMFSRPKFSHLSRWNKLDRDGLFMDDNLSREGGKKDYTINNPETGEPCPIPPRGWAKSHDELLSLQSKNLIWYGNGNTPPRVKSYLTPNSVSVPDNFKYFDTSKDKKIIDNLFGFRAFEYPKSLEMIKNILEISGCEDNDIVMDFFAGSGTTAHAVHDFNEKNNKNIRFIMVQLPEPLPPKSKALDFDFKNIADLSKYRITKTIEGTSSGVKVFTLDKTNIRPWDADFDNIEQVLQQATKSIKDGRSSEDVLYEIFLKYGYDLTTPVETEVVNGKNVYVVGAGALFVCLDDEITTDTVEGIAKLKEEYDPETTQVVFKDEGFADDRVKTNAIQILKQAAIDDVKSI